MCNLLEYSDIYSMKWGSLWNYYRDETNDVDDHALDVKSFNTKQKQQKNTSITTTALKSRRCW